MDDAHSKFSHIEQENPSMVDISKKESTMREACAVTFIKLPSWITESLKSGEFTTKKGPVFHTAIIAGTMAVKNTPSLIPLAHTILIDHISLDITISEPGLIKILCSVKSKGPTGVEMESLAGAQIAALTIYDMCKSLTLDIEIVCGKLLKKTGGKHDHREQC